MQLWMFRVIPGALVSLNTALKAETPQYLGCLKTVPSPQVCHRPAAWVLEGSPIPLIHHCCVTPPTARTQGSDRS